MEQKYMDILVCPQSKGKLHYDAASSELRCKESGLAYPVRDGIPVMLTSEARTMTDEERDALP